MSAARKEFAKQNEGNIRAISTSEVLADIALLDTLQWKALVAFLYLSGCRISEVVKYSKKLPTAEIKPGIKLHQFVLFDDGTIRVNGVRVLKRRVLEGKPPVKKDILIVPNVWDVEIKKVLVDYLQSLSKDNADVELWGMSRQWAHKVLSEKCKHFPHIYRHSRATHLAEYFDFTMGQMNHFFGWSNMATTALRYVHAEAKDVEAKLRKK